MSKLGSWSTTPGSNNATPPDGWPEGMAPSAVNDAAREMMASIRTAFNDLQYFDPNLTPTYVGATQFSVAGNQTSAIHAGRRLKIFDATAGAATTIYATVITASFTAVTNIHISADGGQLTSSLSSFAIATLSQTNPSYPREIGLNSLSVIAMNVANTFTASAAYVEKLYVNSTLTANGTIVAANVCKAWVLFAASAGVGITSSFNVASVSRSAVGVYRINFSTAFADNLQAWYLNPEDNDGATLRYAHAISVAATNIKFSVRNAAGVLSDATNISAFFYR